MKFIVCSDLHLRADVPKCRTETQEGWVAFQHKVLTEIMLTANNFQAPILIVGDIFHTPRVPYQMRNMFVSVMDRVQKGVYILPGQHDLPNHRYADAALASYGSLPYKEITTMTDTPITAYRWGMKGEEDEKAKVLCLHELTLENPNPMIPAKTAQDRLNEYPEKDIIITGDNHKAFTVWDGDRVLVNCGCATIQSATEYDYAPRIAAITYDETDGVTQVKYIQLPTHKEYINADYIEKEKQHNEQIEAFIQSVKSDAIDFSVSFIDNLRARAKDLPPLEREIIQNYIEGVSK